MPSIEKELMFNEIEKEFAKSAYVFFSSFEKLSVADLSKARARLNQSSNRSLLVKHAMARKILKNRGFADSEKLLTGSVLLTFGDKEPQDISRAVVESLKISEKIKCSGVLFEGKLESSDFVKRLSSLPSRQELLTQIAVRMNSPITGFVCVLANTLRGLVIALDEVRKQKEAAPAS